MAAPDGEVTGELAEGVVPGLLRELYVGRKNGTLHFSRGSEEQSIRVRRGHIVNARTNVTQERLGEILVRHGRLSEEDLERAAEVVLREKKRLGEVLVELGLIEQAGLEDAIALRVHEMLSKVFTWNDGTYRFEEEEEAPGELTLKLSTGELILEAVRAIRDPDVVRYLLGDMDRVLAPSSDPILRFQKLALTPDDGFVLSRVDGTLSAREVEQQIPLPPEEVRRSLLALISTGVVEYEEEKTRPRSKTRVQPRVEEPRVEEPRVEEPRVEEPSEEREEAGVGGAEPAEEERAAGGEKTPAAKPLDTDTVPVEATPELLETPAAGASHPETEETTEETTGGPPKTGPREAGSKPEPEPKPDTGPVHPPGPGPAPGPGPKPDTATTTPSGPLPEPPPPEEPEDGAGDERRREIEEAWQGLKQKDHFEILGLTPEASAPEVKEAYFKLAKRFHPDVHHGASLGDLRDKLETVFIRLGEAYEVLRDPEKRGEYEERLQRFKPRPASRDTSSGSATAPEPEEPAAAKALEAAVVRAEKLYAAAQKAKDDLSLKQNYFEAIQLVDPIVVRLTGKLRFRARLVLARCLLENPNWVKRAEENLRLAIEEQPEAAEAYALLGELYAEQGLRTRAAGMLRKSLDLKPNDREAAEALDRLEARKAPDEEKGGGLLKKIFKR